MRRIILPILTLLIVAQSCQSPSKKKAFDFNQKLSGISDSLAAKGSQMGTELKTSLQSRDFSNLAAFNKDLIGYVDARIKELNSMEDISGSSNLKNAMIDFLKYERELITEGVVPFESMGANTTDEEIQTATNDLMKKTEDEKLYLQKVQDAQREYAKKNGFKIKEK